MVACIEFHCASEDLNLAIEDTFVIDDGGAIIISRAPDEFGPEGKVTGCRRWSIEDRCFDCLRWKGVAGHDY